MPFIILILLAYLIFQFGLLPIIAAVIGALALVILVVVGGMGVVFAAFYALVTGLYFAVRRAVH